MAAQAKAALESAVREYNRDTVLTNRCLSTTPVNHRALNSKMKALSEVLTNLNTLLNTWITKSGLDDTQLAQEKYSRAWLEAEWGNVDDIQTRVEDILAVDLPAEQSNAQKLEICTNQMNYLKIDIETKIKNLLTKSSAPTINAASLKLCGDMLDNVSKSLSTELTGLSNDIMSLDHANVVAHCQQLEEYHRVQLNQIDTIRFQLAEKTPSESCTTSTTTSATLKSVEMQKSKAPTFSGKTIDYPEFKKGWLKVAGVCWSDENQVEQLKFHVDSDTRRIISRCDTMTEVWKALDEEYAQEEEVINAVDVEALKNLPLFVPEYIVKLINHLPNLEVALKSVNGLDHLCSPARVNYLTDKFDERTLYDWDYFRSKITGTTYERFFNFLLDRYDAAKSSIARAAKVKLDGSLDNSGSQRVNVTAVSHSECRDGVGPGQLETVYIHVQVVVGELQLVNTFHTV